MKRIKAQTTAIPPQKKGNYNHINNMVPAYDFVKVNVPVFAFNGFVPEVLFREIPMYQLAESAREGIDALDNVKRPFLAKVRRIDSPL